MNKPLIIVGFSGFGKEVYWLAERLGIEVKGFLDDNAEVRGESFHGAPVLGEVESWYVFSGCQFVIAVGNPRIRKKIAEKMAVRGEPDFATLVDPLAVMSEGHANLGKGTIICAGTIATVEIEIGEHCIVNLNCTIGHETKLDDFCTIAPLVAISGNVHMQECSEIGTSAAVRQGVTLASGSMLGMGGILTKSTEKNAIVVGNPAKVLKYFEV
ncbi:acetyltransferase [Halomonas sp. TRM85114]|uniref:acetyltransferase n=1 Tax=Halomonas jincaotanensis TaxID=2810616 RepID=UPI001BD529ED|nr:acetyltransferase [Halomonas jincaotanensis]MBS9404069.1 acetyltransferase [Halomonas jincaotanensis]